MIKVECKFCLKPFYTRYRLQTCCNRQCAGKLRSIKVEVNCALCKRLFLVKASRSKYSKSGLLFCSRKCKDSAQKINGITTMIPKHYGTANPKLTYRRQFTDNELICSRCGYKEFSSSVHIHHLDNNHNNFDKKNLIPLCACCHLALHIHKWEITDLSGSSSKEERQIANLKVEIS